MLSKLIFTPSTTLDEAIRLLDANGNGFLPVVDPEGKLLGIFTDGDLRKGIINKKENLLDIINKNPTTAKVSEPRHSVIKLLHKLKRRHMPLIDDQGKYIDVIVLNDFNERSFENKVVIMAGGLGTRLGDLTRDIPKPMLHVKDKPILQRIIEAYHQAGFKNFILCLNYKSEIIKDFFGDGSEFDVNIDYTLETKRLGTAGALSLIDKDELNVPFIVTNGDIITSLDYEDFLDTHVKSSAMATMCVKQYSMQLPYANIVSDVSENLISLDEKPLVPFYINAGIYAFHPLVVQHINYNEFLDMTSLFNQLLNQKLNVKTFKMDNYWIDIGMPNDFRQANESL